MRPHLTESNKKRMLACGPAGAFFFLIIFLVQGFLRNDYNAMRNPVSSLSLTEDGWIQVLNFLITGILILIFSFGIRTQYKFLHNSKKIALLVLLTGIGLTGAGVFSTDPVFGYPPHQPLRVAQFTFTGHMHDLFSLLVFVSLPWACFVAVKSYTLKGRRHFAIYSRLTAIFILLTFLLAGAGFKQTPVLVDVAGLLQRLSIAGGCGWLAALGISLLLSNKRL